MVDHVRKQIRDAVETTLTGLTTTGANVFPSRVHNIPEGNLPALLIYTNQETAQPLTIDAPTRTVQRLLELIVEGIAAQNDTLDDVLDTIIKEVETAMTADVTISGLAKDTFLSGLEIRLSGEGKNPTGNARMSYTVEYNIIENAPTVAV